MANQALTDWYRSGFEERGNILGAAEERATVATLRCVEVPTPDPRTACTSAADEFLIAARDAATWLESHPCPSAEVNNAFATAFAAYQEAAKLLVAMGEDLAMMTKATGDRAAADVARAKAANYDGATAFARLVLR